MHIKQNISLKSYNSFQVEAYAAYLAEIKQTVDLMGLMETDLWRDQSKLILGEGSNILFKENVAGLVLINCIKGMELVLEDDDYVYLRVGAGENWHQLVEYCLKHDYAGIENLSYIPGTVGAAPIQNIGAYGVELRDVFHSLDALDFAGNALTLSKNDCEFGYRDSVFKHGLKNKVIITHVTLRLNKVPIFNTSYDQINEKLAQMGETEATIQAISRAVIAIRQSKLPDPQIIANAGSFFKNPMIGSEKWHALKSHYPDMPGFVASETEFKVPAAWLIEQCGFKGKRIDDAGVHQHHALVLVNYGAASGEEIIALSQSIQKAVKETFNIVLQPEVTIL